MRPASHVDELAQALAYPQIAYKALHISPSVYSPMMKSFILCLHRYIQSIVYNQESWQVPISPSPWIPLEPQQNADGLVSPPKPKYPPSNQNHPLLHPNHSHKRDNAHLIKHNADKLSIGGTAISPPRTGHLCIYRYSEAEVTISRKEKELCELTAWELKLKEGAVCLFRRMLSIVFGRLEGDLKFFYYFTTDAFEDVAYRFLSGYFLFAVLKEEIRARWGIGMQH